MAARQWLAAAGANGALAVAAGAYAAHGLASADQPAVHAFETAVRYHMWHALALVGVAALMGHEEAAGGAMGWLKASAFAFVLGIVLFCGGLYVRVLAGSQALSGTIPVGGLAFIVGWLCLAGHGLTKRAPGRG
ncbi:MAG: DUF423 domain-containing protein [Alphaproteobacteria bacterium]